LNTKASISPLKFYIIIISPYINRDEREEDQHQNNPLRAQKKEKVSVLSTWEDGPYALKQGEIEERML
jgi:hypothetical protein